VVASICMTMNIDEREAMEALEDRIRAILPEQYQDCYEDVQPVSMGSAGLKYGPDG
jgi:sirohydrochlorin cobaltochelatase